jgi:type I restriction enzyme S subunit
MVREILHRQVPQYAVWAFGSRAKRTAKPYSDLDLAIITERPLSLDVSAALADAFSESDLPWRVDVVDWATTGESFRRIIERENHRPCGGVDRDSGHPRRHRARHAGHLHPVG